MSKDDLFNKKRVARKRRETETINQKPNNWLIICEGEQTEVLYFERILEKINSVFSDEYKIKCKIKGTGYNTKSLVKLTERIQESYDICSRENSILFGKVFVVFDKDSFKDTDFNEAISLCNANGYIPLWSNQAFELWFLLHFNLCDGKIDRKDYKKRIEKAMLSKTGTNFKYLKSDSTCISDIIDHGSLKSAIRNAKRIHTEFVELKESYCNCESCTTIYKFFEEVNARSKLFELPMIKDIFME